MKIVKIMKIKKNAPPPVIPVMYGNFHIAPRPIADPAAAKIQPNFDVNCSFDCFMIVSLVYNLKHSYYYIDYCLFDTIVSNVVNCCFVLKEYLFHSSNMSFSSSSSINCCVVLAGTSTFSRTFILNLSLLLL